ncbi:MAG: hypothetical protein ABIA74_06225 [bacterium]
MKHVKKLFLAATILCCINSARAYDPKTFFMPRPHLENLAMEYSLWHEHAYRPGINNFHTHMQVTPFAQFSDNGRDIGKYFALGNKNYFTIGQDNTFDMTYDNLGLDNTEGKVTLSPKQESWGARLDFFQNFNIPFKKLYLKLSAPIFYVRNDLNAFIEGTGANRDKSKTSISTFFSGGYDGKSNEPKLDYAKIPGRGINKTGVGDIDVALGYKFIDSEKHHVFFNIALTGPLGTKPRGEYLFEPVYGNGNHFAAGLGLDASLKLWENKKHAARVLAVANWKYLFEGKETRTLGLKIPGQKFCHYYKLENSDNTSAANILTQNISVRPGNMLEGLINFAFTSSKFIVDLGYNIFAKQSESLNVPESTIRIEKENDLYVIVTKDDSYNIANFQERPKEIDKTSAATPSQLTHKIYAGLGYSFDVYEKYPMTLGLGGSYEFADSKNELEQYAFWLKGIVSF